MNHDRRAGNIDGYKSPAPGGASDYDPHRYTRAGDVGAARPGGFEMDRKYGSASQGRSSYSPLRNRGK